jgi:hypothetical protein
VRKGESFGVVVVACDADLHLARGACASVRHFLGDVPMCLILDGRGSGREFETTYGARVLRRDDVEDAELRRRSFGFGVTKLIGLWEGPFETFLSLDADTVVWGNVAGIADFDRYDFVVDTGPSNADLAYVTDYYYDPERLRRHFPDFDGTAHASECVNLGAFFGRRGVLDRDLYLELLDLKQRDPGVFRGGDQGVFNFMLQRAAEQGLARVAQRPLQGWPAGRNAGLRFPVQDGRPVVREPTVLHWALPYKPRADDSDHSAPSLLFRLEHLRARSDRGRLPRGARLRLRLEDTRFSWHARRRRRRQQVSRLLSSVVAGASARR